LRWRVMLLGYLVPTAKYPRVVAVNARGADGKFVERPMPA